MTHGPVAELRPAVSGSEESIVGNHGGIVAPPAPSAFRAPFPVSLKEDWRQGHAAATVLAGA